MNDANTLIQEKVFDYTLCDSDFANFFVLELN